MSFLQGLEEPTAKGKPREKTRVYYRHVKTSDRAYLVDRSGVTMIKLDRPQEDVVRRFVPEEWVPDSETRPLTRAQVAQCIKAFDTQLCHFLGHMRLAKETWHSMPDNEKVEWIKGIGPQKPKIRQVVFRTLWDLMQKHTRDG